MRVRLRLFLLVSVAYFSGAASLALAQGPAESRTIPVSVLDKDGSFVAGLTAENFRGEFRGQPVAIEAVSMYEPTNIVLLVDASRGVRRGDPAIWQLAWAAARDFLMSVRTSQVRLISFSDEVFVHNPHSAGTQALEEYLEDTRAFIEKEHGSSTRLYDALLRAAEYAPGDQPPVLYAISDGIDTTSTAKFKALREELAASAIRPFFFLLPSDAREDVYAGLHHHREIADLAEACGGLVFDFTHSSVETLVSGSKRPAYDAMLKSYRLGIKLPRVVDKAGEWKLEVVDKNGKKLKKTQLAYPRLLVPLQESAKE